MEDLVHFSLCKVFNKYAFEEFPEFFKSATDIFDDGIYFIEDHVSVGTSLNESPYIHGTDYEIQELGIEYFVREYLKNDENFRNQLDSLPIAPTEYQKNMYDFTILAEFHQHGEMIYSMNGDEYETECYFLQIMQ